MNSVLLKCPQGEGSVPAGQSQSSSSPAEPLQFYPSIATLWERRLPEKCHSFVQSRATVAHPAWANSCSPGAGKGSRGDEETDAALPMCFIWFFLFSQEPRVPLRLSRRVLLVVALQQNALSAGWHPLCGGGPAPPGHGEHSIVPPSFPPWLGKQEPQASGCSRQGAQPQKKNQKDFCFVLFFKLFFPFCFLHRNTAVVFPEWNIRGLLKCLL